MYSPKIDEAYIPILYQIAKARGVPMTHIVQEALDAYLSKPEVVSVKAPRKADAKPQGEIAKEKHHRPEATTDIGCSQCLNSLKEMSHE